MKNLFHILFFFFSLSLFSQVEKIEPPFWWVGMQNTKLQLMVYGENIANYSVKISDKDIVLNSITKTENSNYLFLNLDFSKVNQAKKFNIKFIKKGAKNLNFKYTLKQRENNSANRKSFDSSDVIYLIMPDRFANGNPENDSHKDVVEKANRKDKGGRHGGDIQGIINHLNYLNDLGVTALWSTPLF